MADTTTTKSPFARLDTSLMRSTKPRTEESGSGKNKETSLQGNQQTRKRVNKETVKQVSKETSKRVEYPKVTYQLNPTITDMLQDAKIALLRQYRQKVSLAEIVEEAIQHVCTDLQENKETSILVTKFTSKQVNKEFSP